MINFDEVASWLGYILSFTFMWAIIGINYYILHKALKDYAEHGGLTLTIIFSNLFILCILFSAFFISDDIGSFLFKANSKVFITACIGLIIHNVIAFLALKDEY
jgi:hypothetical protein